MKVGTQTMRISTTTLTVLFLLVLASACLSGNAWSAVEFVKTTDSAAQIAQHDLSIPAPFKPFSAVPEPSSLALLGGGLLSMILAFLRRTYAITKRAVDIVLSIIGLVFLSPLMLLAVILIKLGSKGPVIYSQVRVGRNGELFNIYKFRTMKVDAEKATGPVWAQKNDNRLIPFGAFMRKSRIDELPQFINVIMGDMSVIGPRPERPIFVEQFKEQITDYGKRLDVKPGITGLAQVCHRYDETIDDVRKKIKYDILYIKKMCFWTDLTIIARTFLVVLTGAGAK